MYISKLQVELYDKIQGSLVGTRGLKDREQELAPTARNQWQRPITVDRRRNEDRETMSVSELLGCVIPDGT